MNPALDDPWIPPTKAFVLPSLGFRKHISLTIEPVGFLFCVVVVFLFVFFFVFLFVCFVFCFVFFFFFFFAFAFVFQRNLKRRCLLTKAFTIVIVVTLESVHYQLHMRNGR